MTWLEGVRCACGDDEWQSSPAPAGTHTLTYCERPTPPAGGECPDCGMPLAWPLLHLQCADLPRVIPPGNSGPGGG